MPFGEAKRRFLVAVLGEDVHRIARRWCTATVAREVDHQKSVVVPQRFDLLAEHGVIARPAVNEDQCRLEPTRIDVVHRAVLERCSSRLRLIGDQEDVPYPWDLLALRLGLLLALGAGQ